VDRGVYNSPVDEIYIDFPTNLPVRTTLSDFDYYQGVCGRATIGLSYRITSNCLENFYGYNCTQYCEPGGQHYCNYLGQSCMDLNGTSNCTSPAPETSEFHPNLILLISVQYSTHTCSYHFAVCLWYASMMPSLFQTLLFQTLCLKSTLVTNQKASSGIHVFTFNEVSCKECWVLMYVSENIPDRALPTGFLVFCLVRRSIIYR